jgi:hypothetical protein
MSENPAAPAADGAPAAPPETCPLSVELLSPSFRKHVDPKAPVPLRMMGAKGLVPMAPKELAIALYMLTFDADSTVRDTARASAAKLPDKILTLVLRDDDAEEPVLDFLAQVLEGRPEYLEMLALNSAVSDETIAKMAATAPEKILEVIAQNQLRILRHEEIVRALVQNPAARPSTVDGVCDFCVRSGLILVDLPAFKAARRRVLGGAAADEKTAEEAAAKAAKEQAEAEKVLVQHGAVIDGDAATAQATSEEEARKLTISQQVMKLSVAKKIEWANKKGNKEVRTILLRDPNKLVQLAVVHSPRITEEEVAKLSLSRTLPMEVLMTIYNNRQLTKNYTICVNIVNNPKVPVGVAMRFLSRMRAAELRALSKNRNVSSAIATAAKKAIEKANG